MFPQSPLGQHALWEGAMDWQQKILDAIKAELDAAQMRPTSLNLS